MYKLSKSCLLIEDERINYLPLKHHIETIFSNCYITNTIKETLNFLEKIKVDLIFLNYFLPDGEATEILKNIKTKTKIIIMIDKEKNKVISNSIKYNVFDFIKKPIISNIELEIKILNSLGMI